MLIPVGFKTEIKELSKLAAPVVSSLCLNVRSLFRQSVLGSLNGDQNKTRFINISDVIHTE